MGAPAAEGLAVHSFEAVLIVGTTASGRAFRPADWAERLAGQFSSFCRDKCLRYSPCVSPVTVDGVRGLLVQAGFAQSDPDAFGYLMNFAADNGLPIRRFTGQCAVVGGAVSSSPPGS